MTAAQEREAVVRRAEKIWNRMRAELGMTPMSLPPSRADFLDLARKELAVEADFLVRLQGEHIKETSDGGA